MVGRNYIPYYRPQSYYDQADWRGTWVLDGGGVLMNQGIHLVDLLVWYMGDPVEVQAYADTLSHNIEVEDTLGATLRFANGAMAIIGATTTAIPGFSPRVEIYGSTGSIQLEGESILQWELANGSKPSIGCPTIWTPTHSVAGKDPIGSAPADHTAIFRDFIEAVRTGRPPLIDGTEGRRSLATVLAIYRAAGLPGNESA